MTAWHLECSSIHNISSKHCFANIAQTDTAMAAVVPKYSAPPVVVFMNNESNWKFGLRFMNSKSFIV